ncbi:MAG: hypothetical protein KC503_33840 [Myxococcales bacterium]|nr:hypothetical protein [Myxococcales bacterium]
MKRTVIWLGGVMLLAACGGRAVEEGKGDNNEPNVYTHALCSGDQARIYYAPYFGAQPAFRGVYVTPLLEEREAVLELRFVSPHEDDANLTVTLLRFEGLSLQAVTSGHTATQPFEQLDGGFQSSLTYTRDGVEQGRTGSGPVMPGFSDRWRGWLRVTTIGEKTTYSLCAEQVFRIGSSPELENLLLYIPADPARKPWTGRP